MCFLLGDEKFETRNKTPQERLDSLIPSDCTTSYPSTSSCRDNENYINMRPTNTSNEVVGGHENIDVIGTATSSPELQKITGNRK